MANSVLFCHITPTFCKRKLPSVKNVNPLIGGLFSVGLQAGNSSCYASLSLGTFFNLVRLIIETRIGEDERFLRANVTFLEITGSRRGLCCSEIMKQGVFIERDGVLN